MLFGACLLMLGTTCANFRQVFTAPGKVFFVDADCYSRMTRVRAVCEHPGLVLDHHDFENAPSGTRPHTTVPLDYSIALLRALLRPLYADQALDLAGAWISPLLGVLTLLGLGYAWMEDGSIGRYFGLLLIAASPILAHGFELGRPDHQSLILTCIAFALAAEWRLWRQSTLVWGMISGISWAVGLWTSLYEPLILLILVAVAAAIWNRATVRRRERLPGVLLCGVILLLALWIEGWRVGAAPGFGQASGAGYFVAWTHQIGELGSVPPWTWTLYAWSGLGLLAAPVLLFLNRGGNRPVARANILLLLAVFALTCWQLRWGYLLPLVYALSLPWQFDAISPPRHRAIWVALLFGLWPTAQEWHARLSPTPAMSANLAEQRTDAALLQDAAAFIADASAQRPALGEPPADTILAPWWHSPALAYWSRQPAVAGSSHEALPGTVDAARFFLATDARQAAEILRHRRVRWVVAYEPARVQTTSASLLNLDPLPTRFLELALYERPEIVPRFLHLVFVNQYFKIYEVQVGSLPHE